MTKVGFFLPHHPPPAIQVESGAAFAAFHADGMRWVTDATYVGLEAVGDALAHVNGGHVTGKVSLLFDWGQRTGTM